MNKYLLGAITAFVLTVPATANATDFHVGSANFFLTSGTPTSPAITATFFDSFDTTTDFDDSFLFTIPQDGLGSGSLSTSFSSDSANKVTITGLWINGTLYDVPATDSGQSVTVGGIPIMDGVQNVIRVTGSAAGSGVYSGTATFAASAAAVPEASIWAMMIAGFAAVGMTFRRRTTQIAFS